MKALAFVLIIAASFPAAAQDPAGGAMPAAPVLESGLGNAHFAVTTSNREAQKFFDQGMSYLYGFNHEAAVRSFHHATELDPDLAMGYWGIAFALGPNI